MTAQVHERLILNGEMVFMLSTPVIPAGDDRIVQVSERRIPKPSVTLSSACWRKYLGTWEIKDGKLYLVGVEGVFRLKEDSPVFADWVLGEVRVPSGAVVGRRGYQAIYEEERIFQIEKGIVVKSWIHHNGNSIGNQTDNTSDRS